MKTLLFSAAFLALVPAVSHAQRLAPGSALIDFDGYLKLSAEVQPYRAKRLIPLSTFNAMASQKDVLILDARSAQAFKEGHIKGAVNLPLPDFSADALARLIGTDNDRPILIYCNNNFSDNRRPVVTKALPLALNIQTFVNLYGYGYRNVWELGDVVRMAEPEVRWVSSIG